MPRWSKLRPPNGWGAVAWDLAVVTLGVFLALAAQQWAENRAVNGKVEAATRALRDELAEHYGFAVEFRAVYPCVQAQLRRLRDSVISSGALMEPVPVYEEQNFHFVLRFPSKVFPTAVWDGAVNDGLIQRFEPAFRRQLAGHYAQIAQMQDLAAANDAAEQALNVLAHRLPLDPAVRYSVMKEIEQLNGRLDNLDLNYGQTIEDIEKVGMVPPVEEAKATTERYGTFQFCKTHGLPMRSFKEAMEAVPN